MSYFPRYIPLVLLYVINDKTGDLLYTFFMRYTVVQSFLKVLMPIFIEFGM